MREGSAPWMRSSRVAMLLTLPLLAVSLNLMVWVTAVSRSGFWADDFLNLTSFNRTFGELSNDHINKGKYVINAFWALGTDAFGLGSVVPYLLLNSLVFGTGLVLWLWVGSRRRWSAVDASWAGALFLATATWLQTALWSSNITHSCGFLALGVGLLAHERCMSARTLRTGVAWSLLGGAAWTLALVSNLLYLGLLAIAAYCTFHQVLALGRLGLARRPAVAAAASWNLVLPLVYFATVAYPATTSSSTYAESGLKYVHGNYDYYKYLLAPTAVLVAIYLLALLFGAATAIAGVRRRDLFPLAVLAASAGTVVPALLQGQQREIHYVAMPLLLLFCTVAAGARPRFLGQSLPVPRMRGALLGLAIVALVLVFAQGANLRSFFVDTPYGAQLAKFRSQVAAVTPAGVTICAKLALDPQHQALLIAELSGAAGFLAPPIDAAGAYLYAPGHRCPSPVPASQVTIGLDARGDFAVTRSQ
jgi:hypothetical protein